MKMMCEIHTDAFQCKVCIVMDNCGLLYVSLQDPLYCRERRYLASKDYVKNTKDPGHFPQGADNSEFEQFNPNFM